MWMKEEIILMSKNKHKPDRVRMEVISELMATEQNGGSNKKIDILFHLLAEEWTGTKSLTLDYLLGADYDELISVIDVEVNKRNQINR
jgi:hypothetical protein